MHFFILGTKIVEIWMHFFILGANIVELGMHFFILGAGPPLPARADCLA